MALTKLGYLRYAEPVEALYMNCSTQLILNIARHFATGKGLSTAEWQLKKLSELQSLTAESIEIIAANTGKSHDEVARVFREVMGVGLADTEKVLAAAVKAGVLSPVPSIEDSAAMRNILQNYIAQADDTLNLVNTVMLQSTLDRYRYIIDDVARVERLQNITNEAELAKQLQKTQGVLNTATGSVVIGAESRTKALRDAIKQLSSQGITGWVDRGGHRWTAEAYVNMDIRTTVHNVAIEAQKERSAEYGVSTFQISTHSGARPLCAPFQGWICSWDNSGGTVTDLHGKEYQVHGISETSYGEAAGIFGINCGHFPETFVDGFSVPRYNELTPEEEARNAVEYAESQQQRELEREIRQAKTDAAALDAMGDKEGFRDAAAKVKEKQNEYKQFCEQTGRTPRPDRTQVSTYGRSQSGKVTWANRKAQPTKPQTPITPTTPAKEVKIAKSGTTLADLAKSTDKTEAAYAKLLQGIYENGNELARKVWEKYLPNGNAVENWYYNGTPHCMVGDVFLNIEADMKNPRGNGITFFHEHGHAIDFESDWASGNPAFIKALRDDYKAARLATGKKDRKDQDFSLWLQLNALDDNEKNLYNGVSDIFEGLSTGKVVGRYGHGVKYWRDDSERKAKEAWAHCFEAAFFDGQRAAMQKYFPTAYNCFLELLGGLLE